MPDAPAPAAVPVAVIEFCNVTKRYGDVVAADGINLSVLSGEFLSFLGPSGCGKTTALRMIAGFEQPSEGEVRLEGVPVNTVPAYKRPVNMVFQHYALFPHLDVAGNVAYGLKQQRPKRDRSEIAREVDRTLELVRLGGYQTRRIWEMSGGQQQRVALARALINNPRVLLLDEPLAALDRKLRGEMQFELQTLQRDLGITFILVTHDQEEALSMSDRVCIMRDGRIVQIGSPRDLYDNPSSRYVAGFVGKSNFFEGTIDTSENGRTLIDLGIGASITSCSPNNPSDLSAGREIVVSVRPEQMVATRNAANRPENAAFQVEAAVRNRIFLGEHTEYLLHNPALGEFLLLAPRQSEMLEKPLERGETVHVSCGCEAALVLSET